MKKLLTTLLFLVSTTFVNASDIKLMTENYPPYNMEVNGELQGLTIEVTEAILKELGLKQNKFDIELLSWSKVYSTTLNNKNHMISATRTTKREKLFKWVGPVSKTTIGIIALKSKKIIIKDSSDLKKYKIGAVKKDIGETLLLVNNVPKKNIQVLDGTNSLANAFYKLERDKIDMFAYETKVARYSADLNGYDIDDYEVIYTLKNAELHFAFNRLTPDATIQKWQKALDEIKANGIYSKIIEKY